MYSFYLDHSHPEQIRKTKIQNKLFETVELGLGLCLTLKTLSSAPRRAEVLFGATFLACCEPSATASPKEGLKKKHSLNQLMCEVELMIKKNKKKGNFGKNVRSTHLLL